jgi:hypothetical protein
MQDFPLSAVQRSQTTNQKLILFFIAASNICRLLPSLVGDITCFASPGFKITATAAERIAGELAAMSVGGRDFIVANLLVNFAFMCCNDEAIPVPAKREEDGKYHIEGPHAAAPLKGPYHQIRNA